MTHQAPECPPVCAQIGHDYLSFVVWRCNHHGRISGGLTRYHEDTGEPTVLYTRDLDTGPFTAADEVRAFAHQLIAALQEATGVDLSTV